MARKSTKKTAAANSNGSSSESAVHDPQHNVKDMNKIIRECRDGMIDIRQRRRDLNEEAGDIRKRLKDAGATSVMPAGSPIGSGQGILNPNNLRICLEYLKDGDPDYPVIVDAGVGTASDVAIAMELGVEGVLLNTGIAQAKEPARMATAMKLAVEAGRHHGHRPARAPTAPRKALCSSRQSKPRG